MKRMILVGLMVSVSAVAGQPVQPPPGSTLLLRAIEIRFPTQGEMSHRDAVTYVRQIEVRRHVSLPSQDRWLPYAEAEAFIVEDAERLWQSGQLETLWVEVGDDPYENGVMAKRLIFNLVERLDVEVPAATYPTPPPMYRVPPSDHERLYPPQGD